MSEYPKGRRHIEMTLVRLISRGQAWADLQEIANALNVVGRQAESMKAEQIDAYSDCNSRSPEPPKGKE